MFLSSDQMVNQKKQESVVDFNGFPHGLNTAVPSPRIEITECSELVNWKIKKGGKLITRDPIAVYSNSATTSNSAVKTIQGVRIGSTDYTLLVDANHIIYYLDGSLDPTSIGTLEGFATILPYNGIALIMDGSFLKYLDGVSSIKMCYDDGSGTNGFQFDYTSSDDDDTIALGNGTNTRIATKFTSQAWETGYTIPPTTVKACLCKTGSPTGTITMKIRAVTGDTILATKTFLADVTDLSSVATQFTATFASGDITNEMAKSTAYYCTLEHSGGDGTNHVLVHYADVASSGTAYHYDGSYNANSTKNFLMALSPGMPPKGQFGAVYESRPFVAGDPDNLGYVWYGNLSHLDWSSADGGGYIGVIDDNRNNFEVGGMSVVYGNLMVYGTETQPYLSQLSGGSPTDFLLSPLFQKPWSTYKTLINAQNDLWAGSSDGVDPLTGVQEYGDFRTFSASDPIEDRIADYWSTSTAIAGYHPLEGQYWLVMPTYRRVLVSHVKLPSEAPSGVGTRYPWVEYELYRDTFTSTTYKWTASGSGTNEYYLQTAAGGDPSIPTQPDFLTMDDASLDCGSSTQLLIEDEADLLLGGNSGSTLLTEGTAGSLADHEWDYKDNDTLGYNTIYFADASGDPDTSGVDIRSVLLPTALNSVGSLFLIGGSDGFIYKVDPSKYRDLGSHQIIPRLTTACMEVPYGHINVISFQLLAGTDSEADLEAFFLVSNQLLADDVVGVALTVAEITEPVYINFNSLAIQVCLKNISLDGDPIYLSGFGVKVRGMQY